MKNSLRILTLLFISILFTNCASIVSKSKWPLSINTTPSGAAIEITNREGNVVYNGMTPSTVTLKSSADFFKKESYKVKLTLDGYMEKVVPVECTVNGWYIGNVAFGGLIGLLIVDPATGAMYKLEKEIINESLQPLTADYSTPTLKIIDINSLSDEAKAHLISINF